VKAQMLTAPRRCQQGSAHRWESGFDPRPVLWLGCVHHGQTPPSRLACLREPHGRHLLLLGRRAPLVCGWPRTE